MEGYLGKPAAAVNLEASALAVCMALYGDTRLSRR